MGPALAASVQLLLAAVVIALGAGRAGEPRGAPHQPAPSNT